MPRDSLAEVPDEALLVLYANGDPEAARREFSAALAANPGFHPAEAGNVGRVQGGVGR